MPIAGNATDDLVPGDYARAPAAQFTFNHMVVSAADAAGGSSHQDLVVFRNGRGDVGEFKR